MAVSDVSVSGCKPCLGGPSYQASVLLNLDAVMCCAAVCHHKYMEMPSCWPLRVHSSRLIPPSGPVRPAFAFLPCLMHVALEPDAEQCAKKLFTLLDLCVSSLRRGHANLLCIVPILTDDPRRESKSSCNVLLNQCLEAARIRHWPSHLAETHHCSFVARSSSCCKHV